MSTTFTGQIARIFPLESFQTQSGAMYNKRRILLETVEQYPQRALITVSNDLATNFSHQVGQTVTAHINFDAHPNQEQSNYFNDLRCWRLD